MELFLGLLRLAFALSAAQVRSALSYAAHIVAHLPPAVRQAS